MGIKNLIWQGFQKANLPFNLSIVLGHALGGDYVQKFGINPLVTTATDPEDIWEGGGIYPFSANGTADIVSISSSDAADEQNVKINGLTADGTEVTQYAKLQGQTRVALETPLWRVHRMENFSYPGVDFAGTVYCYSGTANTAGVPSGASVTKSIITDGKNQTEQAIYTIPAKKVGFLIRGEVGFGYSGVPGAGTQQVQFVLRVRSYLNVFKNKKTVFCISTGQTTHTDERPFPDPIPALSDIKTQVYMTTADISAHSTFHLLLLDETMFTSEYLTEIGQPGYAF